MVMKDLRPVPNPTPGVRRRRLIGKFITREMAIALLAVVLLMSAVFFFGLRWIEWNVTFHPSRFSARSVPPGAKDVWFSTADGIRLNGWYFESARTPSRATLIYFHGNSGNISDVDWIGESLAARGFNVLLFDYRGYGRSEGEVEDERSIYADGDAAYHYIVSRGVRPERLVLYGQSLGTTVVADLAARQKCGAVIIESGLSSADDMGTAALPWLPRFLHVLGKNRFESARKLSRVHCPVLITHGNPDPIIPTEEGRRLFAAANEPKRLMIFPGAGHNVFGSQGDRYMHLLTDFITAAIK